MSRSASVVLLAVMIVLSGCLVSTKPKSVSFAAPNDDVRIRKAPFNGEYRLFAMRTDRGETKAVGEPLATQRLRRGERLGFRRQAGRLTAVAGADAIPVEDGRYAWEMRADDGQTDASRTVAFVVLLVFTGALIGQAIFAASWG